MDIIEIINWIKYTKGKDYSQEFKEAIENYRICAGCDKEFIPTVSKRLCRKCYEEVQATWNK